MTNYEAPAITTQRSLDGHLGFDRSYRPESDAEIKHGIEPVSGYVAPTIVSQAPIDGALQTYKSDVN